MDPFDPFSWSTTPYAFSDFQELSPSDPLGRIDYHAHTLQDSVGIPPALNLSYPKIKCTFIL